MATKRKTGKRCAFRLLRASASVWVLQWLDDAARCWVDIATTRSYARALQAMGTFTESGAQACTVVVEIDANNESAPMLTSAAKTLVGFA